MAKYLLATALLVIPASLAGSQESENTPGLFSSYVSLSIELIGFPSWAGSKSSRNEFSNNLINNLVQAQKAPMVIRNPSPPSSDRAIYDATLTTPTAKSCPHADKGAYQCIGPSFFDSYGAFPEGTLYSHNFNLATWNSSGFATLQATVPLACKALRGQLELFELGNEPDLFIGNRRPQSYSVSQYVSEWRSESARFEEYLQRACPDMAQNVKYMFPSVSSPSAKLKGPDILHSLGTDSSSKISQISVHNYMGGATQPGVTLQGTLMNHTAVVNSINRHVKYAQSVDFVKADYVIGEHNSLYGGGAAGLSDTFGAALWAMEFSLNAASRGVIKRVHFHQSIGSPYAAWSPVSPTRTNAPYYGKLAAGTFLADSKNIRVQAFEVEGDEDTDSAYAAYVNGQLGRLAVLNLKEYNAGEGSRGQKKHSLKVGGAGSTWLLKRLTGPGARSKDGIAFNGIKYEAESLGKGVRVEGKGSDEVVKADGKGVVRVSVADSEAVILARKS
ncbi:hypothetical protein QQS21_006313 [Conoideocrella luteorostrata]|uniref:Beta-glucuronidase C-terminal domain-containing protein n=1 Tax=Conoideocrella luteorostrata TaxID=1105319 RepID=A0AAJ0FT25_9HYPO|nr:hypothetical protein QQS21_006313 [Conoideocrella luteorostrata]